MAASSRRTHWRAARRGCGQRIAHPSPLSAAGGSVEHGRLRWRSRARVLDDERWVRHHEANDDHGLSDRFGDAGFDHRHDRYHLAAASSRPLSRGVVDLCTTFADFARKGRHHHHGGSSQRWRWDDPGLNFPAARLHQLTRITGFTYELLCGQATVLRGAGAAPRRAQHEDDHARLAIHRRRRRSGTAGPDPRPRHISWFQAR